MQQQVLAPHTVWKEIRSIQSDIRTSSVEQEVSSGDVRYYRSFHVSIEVLTTKSTVRFAIPDLIKHLPTRVTEKISSHSIQGISNYAKKYFINQYKDSCSLRNCYVCRANVTDLSQSIIGSQTILVVQIYTEIYP